MKMFKIKGCGDGQFNICHKIFGFIRIKDTHVGYGGDIIKTIKIQ